MVLYVDFGGVVFEIVVCVYVEKLDLCVEDVLK